MEFMAIEDIVARPGLRLVLVRGTPSPWGQAAKAMMEYKGLDFVCAGQLPGADNEALVAWAGINSGPVVAWNDEPPLNRWDDILLLLERLAPQRPLLPEARERRVRVLGLAHEICGELGLGWNRRLSLFQPAMESGTPPPAVLNMARKYRYNEADVALAEGRVVATPHCWDRSWPPGAARQQLLRWRDVDGGGFLLGGVLQPVRCATARNRTHGSDFRPLFEHMTPAVRSALTPGLLRHRDRIMQAHFKIPMDL